MLRRPLRVTLLASEWKSSKGGLSTMNRELAIQLAKQPNVSVSFFVPKCCDKDKKEASIHNVKILEAIERPGYEPLEWLAFPPKDHVIDFVVGHGVILGKQAQIIKDSHHCQWVQVVHTAPYELAMYKTYSGAISKGNVKQRTELKLCKMADLVIAVGPKLVEFYTAHLSSCGKKVYSFTPGIFTELSSLKLSSQSGKFRLLVFGRGDSEDFELKGYDIAAQAVAKLNDKSFHFTFVGAPSGSESQVTEELLKQGLDRSQLIVEGYVEDREYLVTLLCASNLVVIPSRTEGFGLTGLEALSAGLPFLVSQNSGFGEAIQEISPGSTFIVDSEDPEQWAEAIQRVRQKGSETACQECQELRKQYAKKYGWETQSKELLSIMLSSLKGDTQSEKEEMSESSQIRKQRLVQKGLTPPPVRIAESVAPLRPPTSLPERRTAREIVQSPSTHAAGQTMAPHIRDQGARPKEKSLSNTEPTLEEKDLVILGCSVSEGSIIAVTQQIELIRSKLNVHADPSVESLSPTEAKKYLERNRVKFCMLVMAAESVLDAYENLPKRREEYENLLITAVDRVAEKVIIFVYDDFSLPPQDEAILHQTIERIVKEWNKGFIAWLKNGRLTVDSDVLAQIMISKSNATHIMPQRSHSEGIQGQTNALIVATESRPTAYEDRTRERGDFQQHFQQPQVAFEDQTGEDHLTPPSGRDNYFLQNYRQPQGSRTIQQSHVCVNKLKDTGLSSGERVILNGKLYYGKISYQSSEIQSEVPGYVHEALSQQYGDISEAELKILANPQNGALRWIVNPKTKVFKGAAANEMLMLKTRVRNGLVSLQEYDVSYMCPNWQVPAHITNNLRRDFWATPSAELCIFSDEKGNLRCKVDVGAGNRSRVVGLNFAKKTWKNWKNF